MLQHFSITSPRYASSVQGRKAKDMSYLPSHFYILSLFLRRSLCGGVDQGSMIGTGQVSLLDNNCEYYNDYQLLTLDMHAFKSGKLRMYR